MNLYESLGILMQMSCNLKAERLSKILITTYLLHLHMLKNSGIKWRKQWFFPEYFIENYAIIGSRLTLFVLLK